MTDQSDRGDEATASDGDSDSDGVADDTTVGSDDPAVIRSVAVTVADVVTALEANRTADRGAVLRITPPFSGRMRARLHVPDDAGGFEGGEPIHLDPATLVADVPVYPSADDTAAEHSASDENDIEARRQRHTERVEAWRETVRDRLQEEVTLDHSFGTVEVRLLGLG